MARVHSHIVADFVAAACSGCSGRVVAGLLGSGGEGARGRVNEA